MAKTKKKESKTKEDRNRSMRPIHLSMPKFKKGRNKLSKIMERFKRKKSRNQDAPEVPTCSSYGSNGYADSEDVYHDAVSSILSGEENTDESHSEREQPQNEKGKNDREHREETRAATSGVDQVVGNPSPPATSSWFDYLGSLFRPKDRDCGISVTVVTQSEESTVDELMKRLRAAQAEQSLPLKDIQFLQLPEHGLETFGFPLDVMVLCYSVKFRRFSITDVEDALYDDFLANASRIVGREKIAVIAHDCRSEAAGARRLRMDNFKIRQPSTFEAASLVMMCGDLGTKFEMAPEDFDLLGQFFINASRLPFRSDNMQSAMET